MARRHQKRQKIEEIAKHLRAHAAAVYSMPIGEQFMGGRDTAFHSAMHQIAEALELLEEMVREPVGASASE